jgi:CRISPR-associated protein Cas2
VALTLISVERVPAGLRGDLSRWMLQPQTGVFVGDVSAMVRDRLWARTCAYAGAGACLLVCAAQNEQGFEVRQHGDRSRELVDLDGFAAVRVRPREKS